ncbi:MAG: ABC transporter permease [Defluviitaleaceae bacterium]|nr:ABC transporter permease [Defluviitaleaceae bacterium]
MWKTIVRRFLILIPQLAALSILIFALGYLMPGDALRGMLGPGATPEQVTMLRETWGLDDPWYIQYGRWMRGIFTEFDFGRSIAQQRSVTAVIGDRMMNTVRLSFLTTLFTYMIAIPLGILAAKKKDTGIDKSIMIYTFVALSMPSIIFGLINLLIFGFRLGWFPTLGSVDVSADLAGGLTRFMSQMHHAILPAITLALISTMGIIYFLRSEIIDNDASDFVMTARSKGIPEGRVYNRHILRNALLPVAGGFGGIIAGLFSGSIFIERVFAFSGMGDLFITSIMRQDWPVANTLILFYACLTVLAMLMTDIIITIIDPRIRIK